MLLPNHKAEHAEKIVELGGEEAESHACSLVQLLLSQKRGDPVVETALTRASEIYYSKRQSRFLLESLLLAPDGTSELICDNMRVNRGVIEAYREFFFDTTVFRDNFDLVDYISDLKDINERVTKKAAVVEGYHYVFANFTGKDLNLSPREVCTRVQAFAYQMLSQAKGFAVTSEVAREAKNWAGILKTFTDYLAKNDPDERGNLFEELRIIQAKGDILKPLAELQGEVVHG